MTYDSKFCSLDLKALSLKDELEREDINKLITYMKPLMNNPTDRNTIDHDNYPFYFNKHLTLKKIKIQKDVRTKEKIKAQGFKQASAIGNIVAGGIIICGLTSSETTVKLAGHVAMTASNILSRANTLVNVGYG